MRIAVFGASGGIGRQIVQQARDRGHWVVASVRGSPPFEPGGMDVVVGDPLDPGTARRVVDRADVVLSALGLRRANAKNPWSRLNGAVDFTSRSAATIVEAMQSTGVRRISIVSAAGVGDSYAGLNWMMRTMLATSSIGTAYADLEAAEAVYAASSLDWQCVRPVTLTDGPLTKQVTMTAAFRTTDTISRADVAWWMLEEAARAAFSERSPQIRGGS